jgi:hypothetical protein
MNPRMRFVWICLAASTALIATLPWTCATLAD